MFFVYAASDVEHKREREPSPKECFLDYT